MAKCKKCGKKATFSNPDSLCDDHWADWWVDGYPEGERAKAKAEALKFVRRKRK